MCLNPHALGYLELSGDRFTSKAKMFENLLAHGDRGAAIEMSDREILQSSIAQVLSM